MGFLHPDVGIITVEASRESFTVHADYGYETGEDNELVDYGNLGHKWIDYPHPEFMYADLDDLIMALLELRVSRRRES